ncbi:MAG: hypothetical protein QM710_09485 [Flavobacterium sp.]
MKLKIHDTSASELMKQYHKYYIMSKKIIAVFGLLLVLNSCSLDDGATKYHLELRPIESVDIPAEFTLGQTYPITVHYKKPTTCHFFNNLYYEKNLNVRTIAVECAVEERDNCQDLSGDNGNAEQTFNFYVTSNGSYIFKFYQGKDANGNSIFLEYEVPVN